MTSKVVHLPGAKGGPKPEQLPVDQDITASAIIDLNGLIQSVNSDFTALVQYSRYELADMRWSDCGHPDDTDTEAAMIADLLVGTVGNAQIPRRLVAKDGTVIYGSLRLSPLRDSEGKPISLFAVFTAFATSGPKAPDPETLGENVSVLPTAAAPPRPDLFATQPVGDDEPSSESRTDTSTQELLTLLNHEFRTPLNAIIGFAEMLDRETYGALGDPHYRQYARHIHESGERLLEFLSDMFDLVIGDSSALQISDSVIDPQAPVEALLGKGGEDGEGDRIAHDIDGLADGTQIMADPQIMTRILSFLVADAIRSSGDGEVSVTVDESAADGGLIYTIVNPGGSDTAPAELPFGRLGDVGDGDSTNTRLGLPLCKWLVRLHGGELEVNRCAEAGTEVHVRLPERRILRQTVSGAEEDSKYAG